MKTKKLLATLLAMVMVISTLPIFSIVASAATGTCGEGVSWDFNETTGTLTISGTGKMDDYTGGYGGYAPWHDYKNNITKIVVEDGVTSVGDYAFYSCTNSSLKEIIIANSVTDIGEGAFKFCIYTRYIQFSAAATVASTAFDSCVYANTNITYNTQCGDVASIVTRVYKSDNQNAPEITRAGYILEGWYTDEGCSTENVVVFPAKFSADTSLYANWEVDPDYDPNAPVHVHDWSYSLEGTDTIKATCNNTDTYCKNTDGGSLKLSAVEGVKYTGADVAPAKITNTFVESPNGIEIVYVYTKDGLKKKPIWAGEYTASVTIEGCTAQVLCQIEKGTFYSAPSAPQIDSYTETSLTIAVPDAEYACEYSIDGTSWQESPTFENLTSGEVYTFYARYAETDDRVASASSKVTKILFGETPEIQDSVGGMCTETISWTFKESTGILTISGTGAMPDYSTSYSGARPWDDYKSNIKKVVIEDGITYVGNYTLYYCSNLVDVIISPTVESVGTKVFYLCSGIKYISYRENIVMVDEALTSGVYVNTGADGYGYSVVFDDNVASTANTRIDIYKFYENSEAIISEPAAPVNGDYIFGGWYSDASCSDESKVEFPLEITENTRLYAKWNSPKPITIDSAEYSTATKKLTVSASFSKELQDSDCKILIAVYKGNEFVAVHIDDVKASEQYTFEELDEYDSYKVKVFCWESTENLRPLCDAVEKSVSTV